MYTRRLSGRETGAAPGLSYLAKNRLRESFSILLESTIITRAILWRDVFDVRVVVGLKMNEYMIRLEDNVQSRLVTTTANLQQYLESQIVFSFLKSI